MANFFSYNYTIPFGMNNWFMSGWSFPNIFADFQPVSFNIFDNWSSSFNFNLNTPVFSQYTVPSYSMNYYNPFYSDKKQNNENKFNTDTFTRSSEKTDSDNIKLDDYNAAKGKRLANIALNRSVGWTGYCARYVKNSIQAANLGSYEYGHAYQMSSILRHNKNFKEISAESVDVSQLPAGCVLVYDKGTQGYSKNYGHTEITTGDGRAVSDGITKNLYRKPSSIFIPV